MISTTTTVNLGNTNIGIGLGYCLPIYTRFPAFDSTFLYDYKNSEAAPDSNSEAAPGLYSDWVSDWSTTWIQGWIRHPIEDREYRRLTIKLYKVFTDFYTQFLHLAGKGRIPEEDL